MKINLNLIGISLMLIAVIILCFYYFNLQTDKCSLNPLVFGADMYSKQFDGEAYGRVFIFRSDQTPPVLIIEFNDTSAMLIYDKYYGYTPPVKVSNISNNS